MSRKPKGEGRVEAVERVERQILEALPDIIDALISRAKEGDMKAAAYLADRVFGKAAGSKRPPAEEYRRATVSTGFDDILSQFGAN